MKNKDIVEAILYLLKQDDRRQNKFHKFVKPNCEACSKLNRLLKVFEDKYYDKTKN